MSVAKIRAHIQGAISQIHEAQVEWNNTLSRRRYIEISQLMVAVDDVMVRLKALDMNANATLQQVVIREQKGRNRVAFR